MNNRLISVIIPVYNEEKVISDCLNSLKDQTYKRLEIIVIDDGSTDKTLSLLGHPDPAFAGEGSRLKVLRQDHKGPGSARNLGSKNAKGNILVFVDADMTFDKNFIKDLVVPILQGKSIGTFSKNEMNANANNIWSVCWNINRGWPIDRLIPTDYPDTAPVFRAILKKEFDRVGGFDTTGEYTDDWSLSKKLAVKSTLSNGAIYYHANPSTLPEVWTQARWIGKNEFISGDLIRTIRSLILYSFPLSIIIGIYKSIVRRQMLFVLFKLWYDFAVWISTIKSFFGEKKSK